LVSLSSQLRYATGYFESLFGGAKAVEPFLAVLKDLQSSLGQLNDIRVHGKLAEDYAAPAQKTRHSAGKAFAMGELVGEERAKSRKLLKATKRRGQTSETLSGVLDVSRCAIPTARGQKCD
jgi:CHAD domain-containing protein